MNQLKISIVTPSYNQGQFIERTIKSVLNQNYPNLEYMIIDGGSSDDTVKIIEKYDDHLAYWVSERDNGQSEAINKGLRMATGNIVAYLNSDDILLPGTLRVINAFFNKNQGVDIAYGDCVIINTNDNVVRFRREIEFDYKMGCMIGFGLIIIQPSTFMRRKVLAEVGYFDEQLHFSMDEEFWFRSASNNLRFEHIHGFLSGFRWHHNSKSKMVSDEVLQVRKEERIALLRVTYSRLTISSVVPFKYSFIVRYPYLLKRVFIKAIKRCYF